MKALFDFDFRKFVTPSIIKIVYILIMVMLVVCYIGMVVSAFAADTMLGFLVLIIIGPLFVLVYLVLVRAGLESLIASIRTAENTAELVRLAGGTPPFEAGNGPFPSNPSAPQGYTSPTTQYPSQRGPQTGPADGGNTPPTNPYQK
ncbi:DUF4282 domain-containing protein [Arthrobacter sp. NIO-1057]|uniref:DUF4282 domain-containing protein n=1 Tax=Arthrobacter sp. NIO-1057 TaxID=993071 RepID=UPI00071D526D|nr:DUF4282 domain-containing protein [Arthrobacter sp. NIO-1057]KSU66404.1 hypothetical protein AS038_06900 [Arthrobacter sp. NIO-1057]SCC13362.1 protein of unknown function [Arthrobacter sp. NIO-1057]